MDAAKIIDDILRREGEAFVDHDADRGGPTRYGVTLATLSDWRNRACTAEDVRRLTRDEARRIYRERYWRAPGFDRLDDSALQGLLTDCAVLHGQARTVRWLQRAVAATIDGVLGPRTRAALREHGSARAYRQVLARRVEFVGEILNADHGQVVFALGWLRRVAEFTRGV